MYQSYNSFGDMGIFVNAASEIYCQAFLQVNSHTPLYQPIKSIGNVP